MNISNVIVSVVAIFLLVTMPPVVMADEVKVPFRLGKGKVLYQKNCASCHGVDLNGSDKGPPLVHPFYKPSHHGDESFYHAGLKGVRAHHWKFGDMPPVPDMTAKKMDSIIPFIRYYQQQKNLF